jgi:hypothetical protein
MPAAAAPETVAEEVRAVVLVRAYLTARPYPCVAGAELDARRGLIIAGRDTTGVLGVGFVAQWLGEDALKFLADHTDELRPGRPVDLELHHIKPTSNGDLRARVKSCQLAPLSPSWIAHEEKLRQTTQEAHAT